MRLVQYLDKQGAINTEGVERLTKGVALAKEMSEQFNCESMLAFATSAIRSAANGDEVLDLVEQSTGVRLQILSGEEEARLTFLAVRRWFGWSAGRICDLDIGGGSLEMSIGDNENPDVACSVNLGAGRLTRDWFETDPPSKKAIGELREYIDETLREPVKRIQSVGEIDLAVGTSKTFKMLARLTGAAPSAAGLRVERRLTQPGLRQLIAFISRMTAADRAELEGVSVDRSYQIVAGALVAEAAMRHLQIDSLRMCPWALREGVIFAHTDVEKASFNFWN